MLGRCIIVSGKAHSGKDTIVDCIRSQTVFKRYALADPVREVAKVLFNIPDDKYKQYFFDIQYKNEKIPGFKYSSREMCQTIGSEMRNIFYPEIWCDNLLSRVKKMDLMYSKQFYYSNDVPEPSTDIIISDIRYPNEIDYFRKAFPFVKHINVMRPNYDGNVGIANHPSETSILPESDYTIHNDGTLDELYKKIDTIITELFT